MNETAVEAKNNTQFVECRQIHIECPKTDARKIHNTVYILWFIFNIVMVSSILIQNPGEFGYHSTCNWPGKGSLSHTNLLFEYWWVLILE